MKLTRRRKRLLLFVALLIALPTGVWWALIAFGWVSAPGDPEDPPFHFSDRIVTIDVGRTEDGEYEARFQGWEEGDPLLTGEEFFQEIHRRKKDLPALYRWLDVTSVTGVLWVAFGLAGQAVFMARMGVQWFASERARSSVVPPVFWWLSLLGSSMLMIYFIWRKEIVGFLGQSTGWIIYLRNLWFIHGAPRRERENGAGEEAGGR